VRPNGAIPRVAGRPGPAVSVVLAFAVLGLLAPTLSGHAAEPAPAPSKAPAPPPPAAIPVAEVATRAAGVPSLLRVLTEPLAPSAEVETILRRLPDLRAKIDVDLAAADSILRGQPTLDMLQAQQQLWRERQVLGIEWLAVLTRRATLLQEALNRLGDIRTTWRRTRDAAAGSKAPGPILLQIDAVLVAIEAAERPLLARRAAVLDLQSVVAREEGRSETALAQFNEAQQRAMGGILARDSPPIWKVRTTWAQARDIVHTRARAITAGCWTDIVSYLRDPSQGMPFHVGFFVVLAVALVAARRQLHRPAPIEEGASTATAALDRPYAAALGVTLFAVSSPYSVAPPTVRELSQVLMLVPVIRLALPVVDARLRPELFLLALLFASDSLREAFGGTPVLESAMLLSELLAGMVVLAYSLSVGGLRRSSGSEPARLRGYRAGANLVMLVLAAALSAVTLGYMPLARLLTSTVLGDSALALALYACITALVGAAALALRVWPLRLLQMVQHHRDLLERRIRHVLIWLAIGGWVIRALDYVGLLQPALALGAAMLAVNLGRGSMHVSLGNILEFFLTVWLAYLVSAFIRFVLREDVYPRTHLTRGISYAVSSLLNYVIIILGLMLGLGALGLDVTKVTVLVGAFGVGIGFGLQSVVNNFVSGLILLFERPVHVGDIVEVGDLSGEVSRIGIRASTVRTWQGAEIIVPNAQFVTERVTNWTLSDRTRRIDLPVGVDYGSAPDKVVDVLEAVACAHPQIMQTPAPQAVFKGFGDSSINFELRAWTNRFERWPKIQTELAAALYAALHAAGMSFPFPQREVRLLGDVRAGAVIPPAGASDAPGLPAPPRERGREEHTDSAIGGRGDA
jgi:potassium-dependent mechanosensitive channel